MTGAPSDAVARAADLATRMARNRGDMDEKSFADAVLRELRAERLVAAMVPGPGSDAGIGVGDVARIVHHLGRVSGSVGLIYAMHASQALSLARHAADRPLLTAFLHRLVEEQVLIASGTSEKGVGGDIFRSVCKVEEDRQGGLLVTKDCANISYMEQAGALLLTAMRDTGGQPAQVLILAQAEDMRIEPGPAVGFIGMRGIVNRPYVVTARFSSDAIFAEP
jgi:acyl-CoA dehydrogenase